MTSNVASLFRRVATTSEMSARNRSPAGDPRLARPPASLPSCGRNAGPR